MEQLSSCYFCGAALDAQVDPYQVIPPQLEPTRDQQRAVSLCPSCRQKLGHIVETVVAATDASAAVTTDDVTTPDPAGDLVRNESTAEEGGSDDGGSTTETETTASETPTDQQRTTADDTRTASDGQRSADDESPEYDAAEGTEQRRSTTPQTEREPRQNGTRDQSRATTHDPTGGIRESPSDPLSDDAESSSDQSPDPSESGDDQQTAGQSASPAADDAGGEHQSQGTDAQTVADDDGPSLTALEYNKVMRLLQNREFPVERAEIQAVATNAYEISQQEFDAIIDAAIDRGLIGEEGDQLVSGD